ncbi:MAG: hypothetical protein ACREJQ_05985 [bacterium]
MAGGREYTRAGLIRNPFLWILFLVSFYCLFFNYVVLAPFDKVGADVAMIEVTAKSAKETKYKDLERFMGNRTVYYKGEAVNRILPLNTFKVLFIASVLSLYPTDTVQTKEFLPVSHPSLYIRLRLGIITRTFAAEGFEYVSQLKGHGALGMLAGIEERLFQAQEGSAVEPASASKTPGSR